MKIKAAVLMLLLALAGCARTPEHSADPDEERLRETMEAAEQGPSTWSPAITIPLYPVLLVADTSIGFVKATYRLIRGIFGGTEETRPVPERIERQAEQIPKN